MPSRRDFLQNAAAFAVLSGAAHVDLNALKTPVLFAGDATHAYRDPAVFYWEGTFHLFFTLVVTEPSGIAYSYVAQTKSRDLRTWTEPVRLTLRSKNLDFGSPGDIVRDGPHFILCFQSYPRPHGEKYGNQDSRIWTMSTRDLEHWGLPYLIRVKGPKVAQGEMGRMIDPFLLADKDKAGKWWCFYKQDGISMSTSPDLDTWAPAGRTDAGENPCVIVDRNEYVLFHSPANGIGVKRSADLAHWRDEPGLLLDQKRWPWAQGRLTAAFVLDLRHEPAVGKALMFFHGSRYAENDPRGGFDNFASIGIAWSDDLRRWHWPSNPGA
jgi:hypothetical protein